jgi:outer membrane protein assembly factor BamB
VQQLASTDASDLPPRPRFQAQDLVVVLVAVVLVGWGVAEPSLWPYLIGAGLAGLGVGVAVYHLLCRRVSRKVPRVTAAVVAAVLVTGIILAVPWGARYGQEDGSTRWSTKIPTRWVDVLPWRDRIYLYEDRHGFRVLDRETGRELFAVGGVKVDGELAGDGSMVLSGKEAAEYYGADGKRRWRLDGKAWALVAGAEREARAVAVDTGVVVFEVPEEGDRWRYVGVGPTGKILWQRVTAAKVWASTQLPIGGADQAAPLPSVVVVRTSEKSDAQVITLDGADGTELDRRPARQASTVGLVGDLVVFGGLDDAGCAFTGVREGRQLWHATGVPCANGSRPSMEVLEHRMYATLDDGVSITVDLRTGKWRKIAQVALAASEQGRHKIGLSGDNVIVYRDGRNLTCVDAAKGTRLWTYEAPGDYTPGVDVGSDAVVVFGPPKGHNPMLPADVRKDGFLVTVLDPRSGKTTGTTVLPVDGLAASGPLPGGAALVVTTKNTEARLVGGSG